MNMDGFDLISHTVLCLPAILTDSYKYKMSADERRRDLYMFP